VSLQWGEGNRCGVGFPGVGFLAVIEPALGVEAFSLETPRSTRDELVEEIGDPLARFGLRSGGLISRGDRSVSEKPGEIGDGLQQRATFGAEVANRLGSLSRHIQADLAGFALVMGHGNPFRSVS
jgi:hypothetical protein